MTINGAIMQLVEMRENSMMPMVFKPCFDKVIETISECEEPHPQPQWIPCSEGLPKKRGNYIVTERRYSVDDRKHEGKYQTIVEEVRFTGEKWERAKFFDVVAWMPLPEPYKEDF